MSNDGRERFEDCEFVDNAFAGLKSDQGGEPQVSRCRVTGSGFADVYVTASGRGVFRSCELGENRGGAFRIEIGAVVEINEHYEP